METKNETMRDALFTAWCEDRNSASPKPLTDWLQAYGDYADELLDWISQEPVSLAADTPGFGVRGSGFGVRDASPIDHVAEERSSGFGVRDSGFGIRGASPVEYVDQVSEERTRYLGKKALADFLATQTVPVASLLKTARQQGMDVEALAAHLNLSEPIIYKLERRLLRIGSIPGALLKNVAETLHLGVQQVKDYLAQPPQLAPGAMYRADSAPRATRQDFSEAVATDYELSDDQKAYWNAEIREEGRGKREEKETPGS